MPTATDYIVRLPLSESLLATYEKEAERTSKSLEDFIAQHLRKTKALLNQNKPLVVTDADRQRIETALSAGFNDGSQLAESCERLAALNVSGLDVNLSEPCLTRLHSRCYGMTFDQFVRETIVRLLEVEVGLR